MKRLYLTAALVLLAVCCLTAPYAGAVGNDDCVDIVLVMDCSGSMRRNDPDKLVLHGATMVAEMIRADGWRYGAVMFEGHVTGAIPLREVADEEAVEAIKAELESIYHQNGRWTDLPRGLYEAIQIFLEGGDIGNERVIIALTDGADDPESGRTMKDVDRDRNIAISLSREMNIPVYVIGLNVNGSVLQDMNELISSETGAEAFDIAAADQIEPTLTAILERFRKRPLPPEPTPTPTPAPTAAPTPTPTPAPATEPTIQQDPPATRKLRGLNLFIIAVLLVAAIFAVVIFGGYLKPGKAIAKPNKLAGLVQGVISKLRVRKPYLNSAMSRFAIEVKDLPYGQRRPQATELYLEHIKKKRSLLQVLTYNWQFTDEYLDAFRDVKWFLTGTEFYVKRKENLGITVPVDRRFIVKIDAQEQDRPYKGILRKNRELRITLYQNEDNVYEIVLGKNEVN